MKSKNMKIHSSKLQVLDFLTHRSSTNQYYHLLHSQYLSYDELYHLQNAKLQNLIKHVYHTVEYYHTLMDKYKLKPRDIQNQSDLEKLPILTKEIIKQNYLSFISSIYQSFNPVKKITGGSTGAPLQYYISKNVESYAWGSIWRAWNVGGYEPGDRVAVLGGDSIIKRNYKTKIYYFLNNWNVLPITKLNENNIFYIYEEIKRSSCKMIYAYPTPLLFLAQFMLKNELKLQINHIVTTSEMLFPNHRAIIEKAFNCKVYDFYGANDGGLLSFQCEYFDGYHLCMEKCIAEIVDDELQKRLPANEVGNIVLTDLENYAMPFIRYQVGDRGAITNATCKCGRGLNRLTTIAGRVKDFIELPNGKIIDGSYFTKRFRNVPSVLLFQIVQKPTKDIYAKVRLSENEKSSTIALENIEKFISDELKINFKIIRDDSFHRSTNQKFQYIVKE